MVRLAVQFDFFQGNLNLSGKKCDWSVMLLYMRGEIERLLMALRDKG